MLYGFSLFFGKKLFQLSKKNETISCSMQALLFEMMCSVENISLHSFLLYTITNLKDGIEVKPVISKEKTNSAKNLRAGGFHEQKQK
jgi:hypothetical protein